MEGQKKALQLVDDGLISASDMLFMALNYMYNDDVEDMLHYNEVCECHIKKDVHIPQDVDINFYRKATE